MLESDKKFVCLEGLKLGNRFYTTNDPTKPESEKVKLSSGEVAYKILGYAETAQKALSILYPSMY